MYSALSGTHGAQRAAARLEAQRQTRQVSANGLGCIPRIGGNDWREHMNDPFKTFGPPELCTWRYGPGVCRFQTTVPKFSRKLSQRSRARLVAYSVNKGYLRIFEEPIQPWRARRLVTRYLGATNRAFSDGESRQRASEVPMRVISAGRTQSVDSRHIASKNTPVCVTSGHLVSEPNEQPNVRS